MAKNIRVWDPVVRIFHWSLVTAFFIAYLTGEEKNLWHINSGYAVAGLVAFRLLWGLIGTRHARFSDFIKGPGEVIDYLKDMRRGRPRHYQGHNPAGGWMIMLMLATLIVVSVTGFKVYALEEGRGPLAGSLPAISLVAVARADDDEEDDEESEAEEFWEEIHEGAANFMLFLILLHVTGVVVSSRLHGENLVRAMITGDKTIE